MPDVTEDYYNENNQNNNAITSNDNNATSSEEEMIGIVIDLGTSSCKVGFAGDDTPREIIPTIVGLPKQHGFSIHSDIRDYYLGDEIQTCGHNLRVHYPIENGYVTNWDCMEKIWHHTFYNVLRVSPEECSVLLTEPPASPRTIREKMVQIMFETFNVAALYINNHAVLSLLATGRTTGCVFDSGDSVTSITPVFEGYILPHAITRTSVAGKHITNYLMKMLTDRGYTFDTPIEQNLVRDIKEKLCYIPLDVVEEERRAISSPSAIERSYELPNGNVIIIGTERFRCTNALFNPLLVGVEAPGIHECIYQSIRKCDPQIRQDFYFNIVLVGGSSLFPGITERLQRDLLALDSSDIRVSLIAPPSRQYFSWIGGSIFASLLPFPQQCISRVEYDEFGPNQVHQRCL